jgi:DNA-binding NarL/FixJ family response regulator
MTHCEETPGAAAEKGVSWQTPLKLLIVEDSPIVAGRLAALADASLPRVAMLHLAATGAAALECIGSCRPDAVLLDIELPDMSGLAVLQHIKTAHPHCLVVMLTDYGSPEFRWRCAELGADFFFHKSTEFECAFEVLREACVSGTASANRGSAEHQ